MIIHLYDPRREMGNWITKAQHLVGAAPLLVIGILQIWDERTSAMAWLEVAVASIVFAIFFKEAHAARQHAKSSGPPAHHSRVGWFDLAAGGLLIFEAFHGPHVKPGYLRPEFFAGLLALMLGALHGPLSKFRRRRRYLNVDDTQLKFRPGPFRQVAFKWADVSAIGVKDGTVVVSLASGQQHRLKLIRFTNRAAVQAAIISHASAAGVMETSPANG